MTYPEHRSISARELAEKLRDSKDLRFIDLQDSQLCPPTIFFTSYKAFSGKIISGGALKGKKI